MPTQQKARPPLPSSDASDRLVNALNFIRAIRESGYVNIASALAELLDNSIQASATVIEITIERGDIGGLPRITVEDDGIGMTREELAECLQFGGSSRFDSRVSFGRFGMGLPSASLSQARKVSVTAWQETQPALVVALDVDAVAQGRNAMFSPQTAQGGSSGSGCRVEWSECDRIEYSRLGWLERSLSHDLGRMFRRFIARGLVVRINGKSVESFDPMLLSTRVNGAEASVAFEPLRYEIETESGKSGFVTVTFAVLPVGRWHSLDKATKRRIGVVGQGGVSVLRASREIARGWYLMGGKRKENYDDWWRCEIEFGPDLDEHFGITVNKQGVRPSSALRDALEPELEAIARLLNSRIRRAFEEVKFETAVQEACRIAGAADADLPVIRSTGQVSGALSYHLAADQLPGDSLFELTLKDRRLEVTMNVDHLGFAAMYRPLQELGESAARVRTALELLFLAYARTLAASDMSEQQIQDLLQGWGATYRGMLQKS